MAHAVLSGIMKHTMRMDLSTRNPVSPAPGPPRRSSEMTPPNIEAVRKALKFAEVERHSLLLVSTQSLILGCAGARP